MEKGPLFRWTWDAPQSWQRSLSRIAPPQERGSHLTLRWCPAYNGKPAQRWVVFEAVPVVLNLGFLFDMRLAEVWSEQNTDDPMIQFARKYIFDTGCMPFPFWVCQGNQRGHPWAYNTVERTLAKGGLMPPAPPAIGTLRYCEPTELTWRAIVERREMNKATTEAEAEKIARRAQVDKAVEDQSEIVEEASRLILPDARIVSPREAIKPDWDEKYIDTGLLH